MTLRVYKVKTVLGESELGVGELEAGDDFTIEGIHHGPMKLYTLRHKATGEFMPCRPCSSATGFTLWTPGDKTRRAVDANPRIFYTLRSAQMAKVAWVRGEVWKSNPLTLIKTVGPSRHTDDLEIMFLHTSDWVTHLPLNPAVRVRVTL